MGCPEMISLSYFTHSSVELENLAIHAMRLHYKAYFSLIPGRLGVEYVVMIDDKPNVGTWDIWKSDSLQEYATNPEIVGEEEGQDIEELRPASIFCVI